MLQQELTKRGITYEEQQLPSGERQMVNVSYQHDSVDKPVNDEDEPIEKSQGNSVSGLAVIVGVAYLIVLDRNSFSMSQQMFDASFPVIFLLTIPLFYVCWRQWKKAQLHQSSWFWGEIKTSDKFTTNAIFLSLAGAVMLLQLGVLAFHHSTSKPAVQMAEVVDVYNQPAKRKLMFTRSSGLCGYRLEAKLRGYGRYQWCDQPSSLLAKIEVGDPIELQGKVSAAGFYVDKFQLKPSHSVN
ncbi:hypothetical protein [Rheinheimera sp. SA_1]|uniref:hypothetical protein n=1 Tax=Rheinheimera sp. SA_1 TaxID=1827365 RepID=UPI0012FC5447|nr:hypothetical protein [Rheinheimera sp. SA_1]